jgi:hypothetical protein
MAWNERTKLLAACSEDGWMTVNCRLSLDNGRVMWNSCLFSNRFGQWTTTNPFTPQRSVTNVIVLLGVQTGNKRTAREWKRPGYRATISFWLGELINGQEGQSNFAFLILIFVTVDWAWGRLSFGLRWQKKRRKFSSVNVQVVLIRCRFHPTGGFSHQRTGLGKLSSGQLR